MCYCALIDRWLGLTGVAVNQKNVLLFSDRQVVGFDQCSSVSEKRVLLSTDRQVVGFDQCSGESEKRVM